jgi:hypothetical protein
MITWHACVARSIIWICLSFRLFHSSFPRSTLTKPIGRVSSILEQTRFTSLFLKPTLSPCRIFWRRSVGFVRFMPSGGAMQQAGWKTRHDRAGGGLHGRF